MLSDIEKSFDSAFFGADQHLKYVSQTLMSLDDIVLSDDLSNTIGNALTIINNQLSNMAFCFGQLMCKTILYSENYFIIKERFQQIQMENFSLKSDKLFMDFVRKMNRSSGNNLKLKSNGNKNNQNNRSNIRSPIRSNRKKMINNNSNNNNNMKMIYSPPATPDHIQNVPKLEDNLLNNSSSSYLHCNATFRMHRLNNAAFKLIYRNFKETELINDLTSRNISLQKELIVHQSELCNYRLVVQYLNNQMSGRIQQIQLLTRDKIDSNFDKVWADLESEIKLNKCKTIVQAFASSSFINNNRSSSSSSSLFEILNPTPSSPSYSNVFKSKSISESGEENMNQQQISSSSSTTIQSSTSSATTTTESSSSIHEDDLNVNTFNEENILKTKLKNFKSSWFNMGMLRFIFINLVDEAIGISIIGGKEYGLPIIISEVHANTPASRSEAFKPGDIILTVNFIDLTDIGHDDAVQLLKNINGKTRFGVIYLKSDEPRYNELRQWLTLPNSINDSNDQQQQQLSSNELMAMTSISMIDMPQLLHDFYRSIFNTILTVPYDTNKLDYSSDEDTEPEIETDNDDDDRNEKADKVNSDHVWTYNRQISSTNEINMKMIRPLETLNIQSNNHLDSNLMSNDKMESRTHLQQQQSKPFPGMATRMDRH